MKKIIIVFAILSFFAQKKIYCGTSVSKLFAISANAQLLQAAIDGNIGRIQEAINNDADKDIKNNGGYTALICAACRGHKDIVELLINSGADTDIKNNSGDTALIWAAYNGHKDIVEVLINSGADTDIKNNYGYRALDYANQNNRDQVINIINICKAKRKETIKNSLDPFIPSGDLKNLICSYVNED